jgi:hypothetical protein
VIFLDVVRAITLIEAIPFTTEEYRELDKRTFLGAIVKRGKPYRVNADELLSI